MGEIQSGREEGYEAESVSMQGAPADTASSLRREKVYQASGTHRNKCQALRLVGFCMRLVVQKPKHKACFESLELPPFDTKYNN